MGLLRSMTGMLQLELTSAEPGKALFEMNSAGISVFDVEFIRDLTVRFRIQRRDYRKLCGLCRKRAERLHLLRREGVYWTIKRFAGRPFLWIGTVLLLLLVLYLPGRVLFVQVEGNLSVPARLILDAAEECGIRFGASRREVRSERMKNALLEAVPQLQWAGVNTKGCVAVITVSERSQQPVQTNDPDISSVVAARDGVIISCNATRGNLLCRVGQAVTQGQVLISAYTDCGICLQATRAEGEIVAQTNRQVTAVVPLEWSARGEIMDIKKNYSILIGKKRINLWKDSGIWDASCGRMYEEYYITLPGGFQLPVALAVETYVGYQTTQEEQTVDEDFLTEFASDYLAGQMLAGTIVLKNESFCSDGSLFRLEGEYVCMEMIGKVQREMIGEENGKSN